jgi:hypothetical protein
VSEKGGLVVGLDDACGAPQCRRHVAHLADDGAAAGSELGKLLR